MLTEAEAQELHENIGWALETLRNGDVNRYPDEMVTALTRARELAAVVVSDTTPKMICRHCHKPIIEDHFGTWVDETGGDVCGWDGGNEEHEPGEGDGNE